MQHKMAKKIFSAVVSVSSITVKAVNPSADMVLIHGATDGGDITQTGLLLNEGLPDKMTQYKAGNGYVLFTPARQSISQQKNNDRTQ